MVIIRQKKSASDLKLIKYYQQSHDPSCLGELFKRYSSFALAVSMKYLKDEEKSKDAVMDVFEKLAEDLKTQQIQFFKSWLYMVVRNHCLMILRAEKTRQKHQKDIHIEEEYSMEKADEMHPINEDIQRNKSDIVDKAVESLKDDQKQCIKLFYYEERSYQEIAEITGLEVKKVKSHLQNGKRNLQLLLEKDYKKMNE